MGAIAQAIADYAKPLLDETDGSPDMLNRALALAQLCWNLALLPEEGRDNALLAMRPTLKMDDDEFEAFRLSVVVPMVRRHQEMFPQMHTHGLMQSSRGSPGLRSSAATTASSGKYHGTGRNAPCPCNSGQKYKRCCGR